MIAKKPVRENIQKRCEIFIRQRGHLHDIQCKLPDFVCDLVSEHKGAKLRLGAYVQNLLCFVIVSAGGCSYKYGHVVVDLSEPSVLEILQLLAGAELPRKFAGL